LGAYEVTLYYDTVGLEFSRAVAGDSGNDWINMLAGLGGNPQSSVSAPEAGNGRLLKVAGFLAPGDSAECPSGTGVLAWVQFKVRSPGRYSLGIREASLKDKDGNENVLEEESFRGGAVEGRTPTAMSRADRLNLEPGQPYRLSMLDTRGRVVFRAAGAGESLARHISEARSHRRSREVFILQVHTPGAKAPMVLVLEPVLSAL